MVFEFKKEEKAKSVQVTVSLRPDVKEKLSTLAEANDLNVSALVGQMICQAFVDFEDKRKADSEIVGVELIK